MTVPASPARPRSDALPRIRAFLEAIGIPVTEGDVGYDPFLPGVKIDRGGLVFDPASLRWPGDLLHEAGHLAVAPGDVRASLGDALEPLVAEPGAGEVEAIAWSYAAVVHLGLDPSVLFHAEGYLGRSEALLVSFSLGVYPGAFGLARLGLTLLAPDAAATGESPYPRMTRWLRD